MTEEVIQAIEEVQAAFPESPLLITPEQQGGAYVIVPSVEYGTQFAPSTGPVGFLIGFQYPHSDVYPHFIVEGLRRVNAKPLGEAISGPVKWNDQMWTQISRKSNRRDPAIDTALTKLLSVLSWIKSR